MPTRRTWTVALVGLVLAVSMVGGARADIARFDISGKIYTKWLYWNNDSQGLLNWGNPFWRDEYSLGGQAGDNGVGSEFELLITGKVSRYVEAGVRLKSRFGALWHDWWENGDMLYDEHNTSGQSLGMDHAEYIKLRGYYVRFAPPIPSLEWVTVGSSDLGMFNEWTIGKIRYIDRDNAKGFFALGSLFEDQFRYHAAVIALPRLWVGPSWSTGVGDTAVDNPFYSQDYAYGLRLDVEPEGADWMRWTLIGALTNDMEFDVADPDYAGTLYPTCQDALGNPVPGCRKDHAVDWDTRFLSTNVTLEAVFDPLDWLRIDLLGAFSLQRLNEDYAANQVVENAGFSPVVTDDTMSYAAKARVDLDDPFDIGLSFKLEYFNIGEDFNAIFGARREADVLLTDGFIEGGQLPTLNLANEFVDFDEPWVESCIGWHGFTGVVGYETGGFTLGLEGTVITYNTNRQLRRTPDNGATDLPGLPAAIYPNFLHTDGYTDTDLWDYANRPEDDRGRDPRAVYRMNQDRLSVISVLQAGYLVDVGRGLDLRLKAKFIRDQDKRSSLLPDDDYLGNILTTRLSVSYPVTEQLRLTLGGQIDYWWEDGRKGALGMDFDDQGRVKAETVRASGYFDDETRKYKGFLAASYDFEGVHFKWVLEYLHKELDYGNPDQESLSWDVWRSKATMEVAW